ncbi:MAG: TRAP transporter substrate-binding protein DctP [Candidatus Auribacterota bacterium]|jgi:TRAP-type C4-dicarboxylate transport system substrate-binding protein|nr:TRAP transporter substrate-binding protein DctP [Candidatus Auribacterota bacterium]
MMKIFKNAVAVALVLCCIRYACGEEKFVLKLATLAPEGTTWMNTMEEMNEQIKKQSNGRLRIQFYPGGVMGDELDVIRKMRFNQVHAAGFSGVGLGKVLPDVRVLDLPYLFYSYEEVDYVHQKLLDHFKRAYDKEGYILAGWAEAGFVYMFSQSSACDRESFRKVKLWAWQDDPLAKAAFDGMGISTIPLPITDVMTSLQVGMVDSFYSPPLATIALQWYTRVKYMCTFPITHATGAVLINKKYYEKLPDDLKKILDDNFSTYLQTLIVRTRDDNEKSKETLRKNGIVMLEAADKEVEELAVESGKVWYNLAGKIYSRELLDQVLALINEVRNDKKN